MLVGDAEKSMQSGSVKLVEDLGRNRMLLMIVAAVSLAVAGAIGVFYVQRRLVRRLTSVGDAMRRLSSGDTDTTVPAAADRDEIGEMARSLEVFRAGEIERREMAARQEAEQAAQRDRARGIEQMIGDFRATVTAVIAAVTDNVARMETTARTLSSIASEADSQARAASSSSEQTEIERAQRRGRDRGARLLDPRDQRARRPQANGVVGRAAEIAQNADQLVGQLSSGASRIGDVVKLIRAIAEQTNLLALNATIEAARAGEAGRGFAVVASEVKTLASQTAKATEEIAGQIGAIQGSTAEAVEAIRQISGVMGDISRFTSSIAASVEEQSASTQEIGRNVQQAASGAKELAGNMATVTEAIEETNRSAGAGARCLERAHRAGRHPAAGGGRIPRPRAGGVGASLLPAKRGERADRRGRSRAQLSGQGRSAHRTREAMPPPHPPPQSGGGSERARASFAQFVVLNPTGERSRIMRSTISPAET